MQAYCAICFETYPIDRFVILRCGHCFCLDPCMKTLRSHKNTSKCPQCRQVIFENDGFPIHIPFSDPESSQLAQASLEADETLRAQLESLSDSLHLLDAESADSDVVEVFKGIEKVARGTLQNHGAGVAVVELLKAVMLFKERTVPVFRKVQAQSSELRTLRSSLKKTQDALATANKRIATLSQIVEELEQVNEDATDLTEKCKTEWENACKANEQLALLLKEKAEEANNHKASIVILKAKVQSQRSAIKQLEGTIDKLQKRDRIPSIKKEVNNDYINESLLVMPDVDVENIEPISPRPVPLSKRAFLQSGNCPTDRVNSKARTGPIFETQWNVSASEEKRRRKASKQSVGINFDGNGKPLGTVQYGPRKKKKVSL